MKYVQDCVNLVTNNRSPTSEYEVEKLRRGDQALLAVISTLHTKRGVPLVDHWNNAEPPPDVEMPHKAHYVKRYKGRPRA